MRILVTSDIHGSTKGVNKLIETIQRTEPDLMIISGDITHFGLGEEVDHLLQHIPIEILAVTGNCDPFEVSHALAGSKKVTPLNGNIVKREGWHFCGYSFQDRTISDVLPLVPREKLIMVTHVPPLGINDTTKMGRAGDGAINKWIDENKPTMVLSGHIHEARGHEEHSGTTFINPGPARDGHSAVVELDDDKVVSVQLL